MFAQAIVGLLLVSACLCAGPSVGKGMEDNYMTVDVLVAGGGSGGTSAAIAAARNGARTLIVHGRPMFGGNAASEDKLHQVGAAVSGGRGKALETEAREGGIIEEYTLENCVHNPQNAATGVDLVLYNAIRDSGAQYLLNTYVIAAEVSDGLITRVTAESQITQQRYYITAQVFIDATGDGRLGAEAGAEFIMGREGRLRWNESSAGCENPDNNTQGASLAFTAKDYGVPMPFTAPKWARKMTQQDFKFRSISRLDYGYWWNEVSTPYNNVRDNENIRDELLANLFGIWDYIKNNQDGVWESAKTWAMDWFEWWPCKREGRRFIGQYIMKQQDIDPVPELFWDRVAYGGWPCDLHSPEGILNTSIPPNHDTHLEYIYSTPLRSLIAKDIPNLMFAGRLASFSHVVFGSQRVMKTAATMGQAAGTAAAYAIKKSMLPGKLTDPSQNHVWSIQQQLIRDDANVIGVYNEDPRDHARTATNVTASTEWSGSPASMVISGQSRALSGPRGAAAGQTLVGTNRWISAALPAWIMLQLAKSVEVAQVELIFDTGMHRPLTYSVSSDMRDKMEWGKPQNETVRDFEVEVETTAGWKSVATITGNYQRRVVCYVGSGTMGTAVRVTVTATNGNPHAHINEIRVYSTDGLAPFPTPQPAETRT